MMWLAASRVDLAARAATFDAARMPKRVRRGMKWRSPGVSWRNG
jgi:hypothetical protein